MGVRTRKKTRSKTRFKINAKRRKNTSQFIANPVIKNVAVDKAWEKTKPASTNLGDMGLVYDLKKVPLTKNQPQNPSTSSSNNKRKRKRKEKQTEVVKKIEEDVAERTERNKDCGVRLTVAQRLFCSTMIDKYGRDYQAMARDRKNFFQETPNQLKKKISQFINNPHYHVTYLKSRKIIKKGKVVRK